MLDQQTMMSQFRQINAYASSNGFIGACLNFNQADYGRGIVNGTYLLRAPFAQFRDIPLSEFNNANLNDLGERFRATALWATNNKIPAAMPTFFDADYGKGRVCGTILLSAECIEWRDIPLSALNNVALTDLGGRFRETAMYARNNGFIGGFPNFFDADYGKGRVCGTILLKSNVAEWRDVCITPYGAINIQDLISVYGLGFYPNAPFQVDYNKGFGASNNTFGTLDGTTDIYGQVQAVIPFNAWEIKHYTHINARITDMATKKFVDVQVER